MKLYIYWDSVKDKSNLTVADDGDMEEFDPSVLTEIAEVVGKKVTPDTRIFGVAK